MLHNGLYYVLQVRFGDYILHFGKGTRLVFIYGCKPYEIFSSFEGARRLWMRLKDRLPSFCSYTIVEVKL